MNLPKGIIVLTLIIALSMLVSACVAPSAPPDIADDMPVEQVEESSADMAGEISAEMPYETQFVEVLGSQMAYVETGEGEPILFLHGNPTSKYLWRNVMPHLEGQGHLIAPDLIGMGESDKPDIGYTFDEHSQYLSGFIETMGLENVTLVIHDWGSALGFDYAARNPDNVKAIAFMEAVVAPVWPAASFDAFPQDTADFFKALRTEGVGEEMVLENNAMVLQVIPGLVVREMTEADMEQYVAPYPDPASRKPTLVWPRQIPIGGEPADVEERVNAYNAWLMTSELPKLHVYADPGEINPIAAVEFLAERVPNYESAFVGEGLHFIQEDQPDAIGQAISEWYQRVQMNMLEGNAMPEMELSIKDKAIAVLKSIETGDTEAIEKFVSAETYIQHNLAVPDGRDAFIDFVSSLPRPETTVNIVRVLQDGDHVITHSEYNLDGPKIGFDIFRFEDGLIVEHWDNLEAAAGPNPSGRTMTDGPTEVLDLDQTDANKTMVGDFFDDILLKGKFETLGQYLDGDNYIQHNPNIPDGMSNLFAFIQQLAENGTPVVFTEIHHVFGEGNFVLVVSEATFGEHPTTFYDLYRVENGVIAEHWDIIEPMLPTEQWKNENGKFGFVAQEDNASAAQPMEISVEMPYETNFVEVLGAQMAYVEAGEGDPIVFLHGNPTSKYLWRNIMPLLEDHGRVIAPDLIGMGESDKIDSEYTFNDHYEYLSAWMEAMDLGDNIVFVAHSWGTALAFHWGYNHQDRVQGFAYAEAHIRPRSFSELTEIEAGLLPTLKSEQGEEMILKQNIFVEQVLPGSIIRELQPEEMAAYLEPFLEEGEARRPTLTWPRQIPIDGEPAHMVKIENDFYAWLQTEDSPAKLYFQTDPGLINSVIIDDILALPNQDVVVIKGNHIAPEDSPFEIGEATAVFVKNLRK